MKKLICTLGVIFGLLLLNSCGMKECKCVSANKVVQNDSIIQTDLVDTVYNNTRGKCEDFNKTETLSMDTGVVVYHTLFCEEN
jgi:hypothetical protein